MAKAPKKEEGYFKAKELTCKCGCGKVEFDLGFLATLNAIREECGFSFALSSSSAASDVYKRQDSERVR